jgi:myo-inositol 2-dehydrogenase/D-chiro-inositol 1-dehydrogenase
VYGSEGAVELKNPPETHVIHSKRGAIAHDNPMHSFPQRFAQAYLIEIDEFVDCIGGKAPGVTVADSVNSLLVAEACKRSEELGVPVTLQPFKA